MARPWLIAISTVAAFTMGAEPEPYGVGALASPTLSESTPQPSPSKPSLLPPEAGAWLLVLDSCGGFTGHGKVGKSRSTNRTELTATARSHLYRRQKQPQVIRNLFREEHVRYAA